MPKIIKNSDYVEFKPGRIFVQAHELVSEGFEVGTVCNYKGTACEIGDFLVKVPSVMEATVIPREMFLAIFRVNHQVIDFQEEEEENNE